LSRFAADNPAHRRIKPQPVGVVHILVSGKPTEDRLPQHADQMMAAVLAGASVSEYGARHGGQTECVIQFAIGKQARRPASDVTTEPRNWSIRRRSKSSRRTSDSESPAGFAIAASLDPR
jgi:hypothetical protein